MFTKTQLEHPRIFFTKRMSYNIIFSIEFMMTDYVKKKILFKRFWFLSNKLSSKSMNSDNLVSILIKHLHLIVAYKSLKKCKRYCTSNICNAYIEHFFFDFTISI